MLELTNQKRFIERELTNKKRVLPEADWTKVTKLGELFFDEISDKLSVQRRQSDVGEQLLKILEVLQGNHLVLGPVEDKLEQHSLGLNTQLRTREDLSELLPAKVAKP